MKGFQGRGRRAQENGETEKCKGMMDETDDFVEKKIFRFLECDRRARDSNNWKVYIGGRGRIQEENMKQEKEER